MAERDAYRIKVEVNVTITVQWAVIRSVRENDPSLIANLGLEPKKRLTTRNRIPALVGAPANLTVKHGPLSGMVVLNTPKVLHGITYELQICLGDPTNEESWSDKDQFSSGRKMEVKGLEPGRVHYFRVRCFGAVGHGPWSPIVSLMVI
jgi:hypothetical protein